MGNELPRFGENTGTPPEYDYSKVFAELGGMIVFELMDVYMNEEHPIFAAPADGDDMTWDDNPLTYAALVAQVYRLQNEVAGLAAQVVELREKMQAWEADS